jgi:tetratricopeptide (TPR) repeat protein
LKGCELFPKDVELWLFLGLFLRKQKDYEDAEKCFRHILGQSAGSYPVGLDLGLRSYKTRHALAELLAQQGRWKEAAEEWRAVVAEQPRFGPGWVGLAEAAAASGRPDGGLDLLRTVTPTDETTRHRVERLRRVLNEMAANRSGGDPKASP